MQISYLQFEAACVVASRVYDGELRRKAGVELLSTQHGLNPTSAGDYINDYKCLMEGRVFQRAMSAPAMRFFVGHIFDHRSRSYRVNAVTALHAHISYYEGHYKRRAHAMREIAEFFAKSLDRPTTLEELESELSAKVASALLDSQAARQDRLKSANRVPQSRVVMVSVFERSADVIAEVLSRAHGVCEACGSAAPFRRKSDGTPYLEVHHRVRLADNGEDVIENAVAICPNCHRRAHYGADA